MGNACARSGSTSEKTTPTHVPVPVTLHVYDVGTSGSGSIINRVLRPLGTGAFHCGVEVYGWEWSYSDHANPIFQEDTGVFSCKPRNCEGHSYSESIPMGKTATSEGEVLRLIQWLEQEWRVEEYDVLSHNCCHFADELCRRLAVGSIPTWITNLAGVGASLAGAPGEVADTMCCRPPTQYNSICCRDNRKVDGVHEEYIEQIPVLTPRSRAYGGPNEVATEGRQPPARRKAFTLRP